MEKSFQFSYGWRRDQPDHRDHHLALSIVPETLVQSTDLRSGFPAPYNQLDLGSCSANAVGGAIEFDQIKQKVKVFTPSRLFIYYNERVIEKTVSSDAGAELRDGMKTINAQGACPETDWPYVTSKFADKPPAKAYSDALLCKALKYQRVTQNLSALKTVLASGYPVVFGFTVYDSFQSDQVAATGIVPMPSYWESVQGGHAVVACGYNDTASTLSGCPRGHFICRNSWGPDWGDKGYFFMPYNYLTDPNLASDFWVVQVVAS
jgi:C1A family cysteine protease